MIIGKMIKEYAGKNKDIYLQNLGLAFMATVFPYVYSTVIR